jgi:diketogulonate reductase-like aldo/keto reductase
VLIRWGVQRGTSVLPKSTSPERIRSNIEVFGWSLEEGDCARLSALVTQLRMVDGAIWLNPRGPYRTLAGGCLGGPVRACARACVCGL